MKHEMYKRCQGNKKQSYPWMNCSFLNVDIGNKMKAL